MGRPLYDDVLGNRCREYPSVTATGLRVTAYINGGLYTDCFVMNQKGARKYKVYEYAGAQTAVCKLVSGTPANNGEMQLFGYLGSNSGTKVVLSKLEKRLATDWNGNRYTWFLDNDSTNDYIVLTQVS